MSGMQVVVANALTGDVLATVHVVPTQTVGMLKTLAGEEHGYLIDHIVFQGRVLPDDEALDTCGVEHQTCVQGLLGSAEEGEWVRKIGRGQKVREIPKHLLARRSIALALARSGNFAQLQDCPQELTGDPQFIAELNKSGFTVEQLKIVGYTALQLQEAGYTLAQLRVGGYNPIVSGE